MTTLEQKLQTEVKTALISKNQDRLRALRLIKARFDILKTAGKGDVNEDTQIKELQRMSKERSESAEIYQKNNRTDLYNIEINEISVIKEFLPEQMSTEDVKAEVQRVITELGATSIKEMGKVIGETNKRLAGKTDGKTISTIVKELLS